MLGGRINHGPRSMPPQHFTYWCCEQTARRGEGVSASRSDPCAIDCHKKSAARERPHHRLVRHLSIPLNSDTPIE
jgi:hypothetical protein